MMREAMFETFFSNVTEEEKNEAIEALGELKRRIRSVIADD